MYTFLGCSPLVTVGLLSREGLPSRIQTELKSDVKI